MRELRGLAYLARLTFRRQALAKKTWVALALLLLLGGSAALWHARLGTAEKIQTVQRDVRQRMSRRPPAPDWVVPGKHVVRLIFYALGDRQVEKTLDERFQPNPTLTFTRILVMQAFVGFFLPILTLLYAAAALGDEREERTLVYLLVRPLSLWRAYLAKALGILPLTMTAGVGGFWFLCVCGGPPGLEAFRLFAPAIAMGTLAYTAIFLLFGAAFSRPLVWGVAYAFFLELLAMNLPGTIKRLSVAYHTRCIMYEAGTPLGFQPQLAAQFLPLSAATSTIALVAASVAFLALGAWAFHRREYRDLT